MFLALVLLATPAWATIPDVDGDGYPRGIDCDDDDPAIHPRATETPYDGIDQDCAGGDLCDVDLDGHDAEICGGDDCADDDPTRNPAILETPGDGIDQDCDGVDDPLNCDYDGDGYTALWCLDGTDCNDADATVHPDADEVYEDGIDQDCDQLDECTPVRWVQGGLGNRPGRSCATAPPAAFWLGLVALAGLRRRRC